jgi:signal transduction histidine kinase
LAVRDRGLGIPAADLPHVFERFRRGGNVGALPGSGIGLAAAREIVEALGGTIAAESREGEGSTFTLWLPLTPVERHM